MKENSNRPSSTLSPTVYMLLTILFASLAIFFANSCGSPRSAVRVLNNADATTDVHVSVGSGGSTTVQVDPKVDSSLNFKFR